MISAGRVLIMPRGAFDINTQYEMLDLVSYNGSSYLALTTTIGNLPTDTTKWMLSAYGGNAANVAGNFAVIETTDIATVTHYEGTLFVDENSQFMKATQTINIGDSIVSGTNCTPTTVEQLLNEITAYVDGLDSRNRKLQGVTEIATQTDLHGLALGEYYKDKTTFYVTNAPVGIANVPSAVFRLTVEAGSKDASLATSPLLLTLRTLDGKTYTQGFDGNNWGEWIETADQASTNNAISAVAASVEATQDSIAPVESATATSAHLAGSQLYYNDVLYDVTANISIGDALTDGVNIQAASESITEHFSSEIQTLKNNNDAMLNILGAKNLLPNNATSQTMNGVTFTVNSDGSVTANGTATANTFYNVTGSALNTRVYLKTGNYILSGCPSGGDYNNTYGISFNDADVTQLVTDSGEGQRFAANETFGYLCYICIRNGFTANNLVFKPMIRPASIADDTYVPYAMTNRELTDLHEYSVKVINFAQNPTTYINDGNLYITRMGKLVILTFVNIAIRNNPTGNEVLYEGVPKPKSTTYTILTNIYPSASPTNFGTQRISVANNSIYNSFSADSIRGSKTGFGGQVVYFTDET